jgi:site-specific DNA recombinase
MEKQIIDITPTRTTFTVKKRVAAYARVSCDKDTMLHSLAAQIDYYRKYIIRNPEWEFVGVYADATVIIGLKQNPTHGRRFSPIFFA